MQIVSEERIRELVGEEEALAAVEAAFRALGEGRVVQPLPLGMDLEAVHGEVHVKGAYMEGEPVFALKFASGFYENVKRGLPTGCGLVMVFDAETGFPLALLEDNGYLTELRTGGAGALAVKLLAPERALSAAVIGAGSQARFQIRAIARVRSFSSLKVWGPVLEETDRYRTEMEESLGIEVRTPKTPREAVEGSDLVVTVTPSRDPIVEPDWLGTGATVVAVGADGPEKRELSPRILARPAKVVVDSREQCLRLGETHHAVREGHLSPEEIHAELGEVLLGSRTGREGNELIVCDLTGVGAQDAALAGTVWGLVKGS